MAGRVKQYALVVSAVLVSVSLYFGCTQDLLDTVRDITDEYYTPDIRILYNGNELDLQVPFDFGSIIEGTSTEITFEIENLGAAVLALTGNPYVDLGGATVFVVPTQPAAVIDPGSTLNFTVRFEPGLPGIFTANVTIVCDDPDEGVCVFTVTGTATQAPAPEMSVSFGSFSLAAGSTAPTLDSAVVNNTGAWETFTILNTGTADLELTGASSVTMTGSNADQFAVVSQPASPVAPGDFINFSIQFAPDAVGEKVATISIANNDANENPYEINVAAQCQAIAGPEIDVRQGLDTIQSGNFTYDFGAVIPGQTGTSVDFVLKNVGTLALNLQGPTDKIELLGADAVHFEFTKNITVPNLPVSGEDYFTLRFVPELGSTELKTATISIDTDDADEDPFTLTLEGLASDIVAPELLPPVSISSNNSKGSGLARAGNVVTLTFEANEALGSLPVVKYGVFSATVINTGGNTYQATRGMTGAEPDGVITFTIDFEDTWFNPGITVSATDDASSVTFDDTAPTAFTVGSVFVSGGTERQGYWNETNINLQIDVPIANDPSLIDGEVQLQSNINSSSWQDLLGPTAIAVIDTIALFDVTELDFENTGIFDGDSVELRAVIADKTGNTAAASPNGSIIVIDYSAPDVNSRPDLLILGGNVVSGYWNSTNTELIIELDSLNINDDNIVGGTVQAQADFDSTGVWNNLGLPYAIVEEPPIMTPIIFTDAAIDAIPGYTEDVVVKIRVVIEDAAGNCDLVDSIKEADDSFTIDQIAPTLTYLSIWSQNSANPAFAGIANSVYVDMTANGDFSTVATTVTLEGVSPDWLTPIGGDNYQAKFTMQPTVPQMIPLTFMIEPADDVGNRGPQYTSTDDGSTVTFDDMEPCVLEMYLPSREISTSENPFVVTLVFSEEIDPDPGNFDLSDFQIMNGSQSNLIHVGYMAPDDIWTVEITPNGPGVVDMWIINGRVSDWVGLEVDNCLTYTFEYTEP